MDLIGLEHSVDERYASSRRMQLEHHLRLEAPLRDCVKDLAEVAGPWFRMGINAERVPVDVVDRIESVWIFVCKAALRDFSTIAIIACGEPTAVAGKLGFIFVTTFVR